MNKKTLKKLLGAALIVLLALAMAFVYLTFGEKPVEGSKQIDLYVINSAGEETLYRLKTDAQYLLQAMEEAEGLTFEGEDGPYGMMISAVNGETADYSVDGAYWSLIVNGNYGNYGVSEQPVEDGDTFSIVYTK